MAPNRDERKQTQPAPRNGMSEFGKALLWTVIPMLLLYPIGGFVTAVAGLGGTISSPLEAVAVVSAVLGGLAILVCIAFAIARKRRIAAGILAGAAIGLVGFGLACFAMFGGNG